MPIAAVMDASAAAPTVPGSPDPGRLQSHRGLALAAVVGLLLPLQSVTGGILVSPSIGLLGAALIGGIVLLAALLATARTSERIERLDWWVLIAGIAILLLGVAAFTDSSNHYFSDEAALVHGAAVTLLHGHDPYGRNLDWALTGYGLIGNIDLTPLMNGGVAHTLNYPALPVLASLPGVALEPHSAAVVFLVGGGACVAAAALFLVLPKPLRPLAVIICVDLPILNGFANVGLNTVLMPGALVVCAYRWGAVGSVGADGRGALGRAGAVRALCLGLAAATNQLAWFIAPFLLVGTYLSARRRLGAPAALRVTVLYGAVALAVFMALNVPFIVWGPGAWLTGVLAPVLEHSVPFGQGIVGLTAFDRIGGGAISFYSYGSMLLYLALLALLWRRFEQLGRCTLLLPLLALFTSARSLDSYWLAPIGMLVVSLTLSGLDPAVRRAASAGWANRAAWGLLFAPAFACFAVALATPGPLSMTVLGSRRDHRGGGVNRLVVLARNVSGAAVEPHFLLNVTGTPTSFWRIVHGPARVTAGATAHYVLAAPDAQSEPDHGQKFIVQALTDDPQTMSSTVRVTAP